MSSAGSILAGLGLWLLAASPGGATALHQPEPAALEELHRLLARADMPAALEAAERLARRHPAAPAPQLHQIGTLFWSSLMDRDRKDLAARGEAAADALRARAEAELQRSPTDPMLLYHAGMAAHYQARFRGLRRSWIGLVSSARASHGLLRRALAADPALADARIALAVYDITMDVLPGYFKLLRPFLFLPSGDKERGMQSLREAADRAECQGLEAKVLLAAFSYELDREPETAQRQVDRLAADHPDNPWLRLWRASNAQVLDRDSAAALAELDEVDRLLQRRRSPFDRELVARAAVERACALLELGEIETAERGLQALLAEGIERPFRVVGTARWLLARLLLMRGDSAAAREQVERIAAIKELEELAKDFLRHPPEPRWGELDRRVAIARRRAEGGNLRAAERALEEANQRWGANPVSAAQRARWRLEQGDRRGAGALLEPWANGALEAAPAWTQAELLLLAARVADLEGRREAARKLYERVLELSAPAENAYARADLGRDLAISKR
ncbi:MAG TPA: hypothetical protein VGB99_13325 [Acidobacteriota bacterium]